ncbi:MAG TPA: exonuclease domain-containing protein [Tepidisphaeraceae bacterium]|nr:exonuclease domain-containing protein [Tepidisphaeraceae bacterium]
MISLLSRLLDVPLAFVDVETTGASADFGDRVIEIGIARYEAGQLVATMDELIDPARALSPTITRITGISADMLVGRPRFAAFAPRIRALLDGCVVVGHNVLFDISFLRVEHKRLGCDLAEVVGPRALAIDTLQLARRRFGRGGNGLSMLATRLGVPCTTEGVLARLIEPLGGWGSSLADVFSAAGGGVKISTSAPAERAVLPEALAEALGCGGSVHLKYLDAQNKVSTRLITPLRVARRPDGLTLVAHCAMRNALRHFRLDRIIDIGTGEGSGL